MKRWDQRSAVLGVGLGIFIAVLALKMNLGSWHQPGPGFMPLGAGVLLIGLCFIYAAQATRNQNDPYKKQASPWPIENRAKIVGVTAALFLYALLTPVLGYPVATFGLMLFLFRVLEPSRWSTTLLQAGLTVLVTYVVFQKWLMVQFPRGFLGV